MSFAEWWKKAKLPDSKLTTQQIKDLRQLALKAYNAGRRDERKQSEDNK